MRSWRKNVGRTEDANLAGECTVVTLLLRGRWLFTGDVGVCSPSEVAAASRALQPQKRNQGRHQSSGGRSVCKCTA